MPAKLTVKVEGLRELNQALEDLPKATSRNVVKRTLIKALLPMEAIASAHAPELTGELKESIDISQKLSSRQKRLHQAEFGGKAVRTAEGFKSDPKTEVFVFMGPRPGSKTIVQEFGSAYVTPHPYMRPAWDGGSRKALEIIADQLALEIDAAAKRLARKAAKL